MEITAIWIRTDLDPDDHRTADKHNLILRVMVELKGEKQWRVIGEHRLASGNDIISHISEAHGWSSKKIDPLTGRPDEATR